MFPVDETYLASELKKLDCSYAFYYQANEGQPFFSANCDRFLSASIIKIPILLSWLALERAGKADRTELCDLNTEPEVRGAGFSFLLRQRHLPYQDLLLLMISVSDNLATNLVIKRIGLTRLQEVFRDELRLKSTMCGRKLMDYDARSRGIDNWVSGEEAIRFYELIDRLSDEEKSWVEPMFLVNTDDYLFKRNLRADSVEFYHKTGSINRVLHDWGYTRQEKLFLFTNNIKDNRQVIEVFGNLGEALISPIQE